MRFWNRAPKPAGDEDFTQPDAFGRWLRGAIALAAVFCVMGIVVCAVFDGCGKGGETAKEKTASAEARKKPEPPPDLEHPVRPAPAVFPPDSNLPRGKEIYASGPIDLKTFSPTNDLIRFDDKRVWFESDHDRVREEDDHMIHRAVEVPLKRLVNLLEKTGGRLKLHEAYRAADKNRIHLAYSLHCEGRAVDLTCEKTSLSDLAKLAWQSGFDFVLYEVPKSSGVHLHCSVKRSPDTPLPPRPKKDKGVDRESKD